MYTYFQPRMSVEQEEANIKEMIDEEYKQREQEHLDYIRLITKQYSKCLDDTREAQIFTDKEISIDVVR